MIHASVAQLRRALDAGEISSVELTRLFLDRIQALNPGLQAFSSVAHEAALDDAAAADARLAAGEAAALTGIPLAHSDALCVAGQPATAGSKMLASFVSPYDAHLASRLREAGAIMLGKTAMDEFGLAALGRGAHSGVVSNPWQAARCSGGAASGAAVAVAAGLSPLATALDSMGDARQPAAWCGSTALRPTWGRVSRHGLIAHAPSFDQASAIAASAADCALLLQAIAGFDARDATSAERDTPDYSAALAATDGQPLRGKRIGLPRALLGDIDAATAAALDAASKLWQACGAELVDVELPSARHAVAAACALGSAETSTSLSRYDGVRFGHRAAQYDDLIDMYCRSRSEGFGSALKAHILLGTQVLSQANYHSHYVQAQRLRRQLADELQAALGQCDWLLTPVTAGTAVGRDAADDALALQQLNAFTVLASLAGLPALALPAGADEAGLPLGVQLIGAAFDEAGLLQAGHCLQQRSDWHQRRPPLTA